MTTPPIQSPTELETLPAQLLEIKNKLQSIQKVPTMKIAAPSSSIRSQVLKAGTLEFDPGAVLVMEELNHDFLVIYADLLDLKGPAIIARTSAISLDGANGDPGRDGPAILTGVGTNGNPGRPGNPGREGGFQRVPQVFAFLKQVFLNGVEADPSKLNLSFLFDGYPGGEGGSGGRGGNGSNGRKGSKAESGWFDCSSGPGYGGRGGDGGTGGLPGIGGNGSDGAAIRIFCDPGATATFLKVKASVEPGNAGRTGGYRGPGTPGQGGLPGDPDGKCSATPGRHGLPGEVLDCGSPDFHSARPGAHGPTPTIYGYKGWPELDYRP